MKKINLYLAGDSLVQNYRDDEFIAGWGQYLGYFLNEQVAVNNHAKGGRSSRSFMNEGRFKSIYENIKPGDYLFIEFCHNDDESKESKTMYNRLVSLGPENSNGEFPTIPGQKMSIDYLPEQYLTYVESNTEIADKAELIQTVKAELANYGTPDYYPYSTNGSKGTYAWFVKQYIHGAREKGAIPVLITAPARACFEVDGKTLQDGPGLHGGNNYAYIRAMRQIAEEENTPLLELFTYSKKLFETIGAAAAPYLTSVKVGQNEGKWPEDYERIMMLPETVMENTHLNKYGAYLMAKELVKQIAISEHSEIQALKDYLLISPSFEEIPPKQLKLKSTNFSALQ